LQIVSLLRGSSVPRAIYRAAVAVTEGMQTRHCCLASQLVTEPLIETLLKCLDFTGVK